MRAGFWKWLIAGILGISGLTVAIQCTVTVDVNQPPVPIEELGWVGPEKAREVGEPILASMPPFRIIGAIGDNADADVRLWEYEQPVTSGPLPNIPQETGDCTSFGMGRAIEVRQCVSIARGTAAKFKRVYRPYTYGYARVHIGRGRYGRSPGCSGAEVARAVMEGGVLPEDSPNAPPYSGAQADAWGRTGPTKSAVEEAQQFRVRTCAQIKTVEDLRDAICNGYPCTVAGEFGTTKIRPRDGRLVAEWNSRWPHQMCFDGYDGSGRRKYFHLTNSWGPNTHPAPIDGSPRGGFWVDWETAREMVEGSRRNSWPEVFAVSDFDGFPADELDFSPVGPATSQHDGGVRCDSGLWHALCFWLPWSSLPPSQRLANVWISPQFRTSNTCDTLSPAACSTSVPLLVWIPPRRCPAMSRPTSHYPSSRSSHNLTARHASSPLTNSAGRKICHSRLSSATCRAWRRPHSGGRGTTANTGGSPAGTV